MAEVGHGVYRPRAGGAAVLQRATREGLAQLSAAGSPDDDVEQLRAHALQQSLPFPASAQSLAAVQPRKHHRRLAVVDGFSLHADTFVHASDRQGLERLCRYGARGPLAEERLSRLDDGRYAYLLRRPSHSGATSLVFTAAQLVKRLATLLPPPPRHLLRFHGVFGPNARLRPLVTRLGRPVVAPGPPSPRTESLPFTASSPPSPPEPPPRPRVDRAYARPGRPGRGLGGSERERDGRRATSPTTGAEALEPERRRARNRKEPFLFCLGAAGRHIAITCRFPTPRPPPVTVKKTASDARRTTQTPRPSKAPGKKPPTASVSKPAKPKAELATRAGQKPTASSVRQVFGRDELSAGRGAALRARSSQLLAGPGSSAPLRSTLPGVRTLTADAAERGATPPTTTSTKVIGGLTITPDTVSASVTGGFSTEVKGSKGVGVSFGVEANASVVTNQKTENGVTSFTVSGEASVTVSGGINTPKAGVAVAHTEGIEASYQVSIPEKAARGVDPKTVNPFDPTSMPVGTVITLDGSNYSSNEFKGTFKQISIETKVKEAEGVSVAIEKTGANTVRVTAGPTKALDAYNGAGFDVGVVSGKLGRNDKVSSATLKTAEFDLSTAEGKAAYNDFLATGKLPTREGKGVSDVATIEKLDISSQSSVGVSLGPFEVSAESTPSTGSSVVVTHPDGTKDVTANLDPGGHVPMQVTYKLDARGKEIVSERRYSYTVKVNDESSAAFINDALIGGAGATENNAGPVKKGQTVTLTFTEAQMAALMKQAKTTGSISSEEDHLDRATAEGNTTADFAFSLGSFNDAGFAENVFDISHGADGKFDGTFEQLDVTVTAA